MTGTRKNIVKQQNPLLLKSRGFCFLIGSCNMMGTLLPMLLFLRNIPNINQLFGGKVYVIICR